MKIKFSRQTYEKTQISKFMAVRPAGAELFHAGGQTDRHDEAKSLFAILRTRLKTHPPLNDAEIAYAACNEACREGYIDQDLLTGRELNGA